MKLYLEKRHSASLKQVFAEIHGDYIFGSKSSSKIYFKTVLVHKSSIHGL